MRDTTQQDSWVGAADNDGNAEHLPQLGVEVNHLQQLRELVPPDDAACTGAGALCRLALVLKAHEHSGGEGAPHNLLEPEGCSRSNKETTEQRRK